MWWRGARTRLPAVRLRRRRDDIPTASVSVVDYPADGGAPTVVSTGFKPALSKEDEERLANVKLEAET